MRLHWAAIRNVGPQSVRLASRAQADLVLTLFVGLGAALIGAVGALGAVWFQSRQQGHANDADARERAYLDLLVASIALARRVRTLLTTVKVRSGIGEGIAVTFGQREAMDAMILHEWIEVDFRPLMDAWTRVWACGSADGVRASNTLLDACRDVMSVLDLAAPPSLLGKLRQTFAGVNTDELLVTFQDKLAALAVARKNLAELVRAETSRPTAELFTAQP